jgi:hypothetical protein
MLREIELSIVAFALLGCASKRGVEALPRQADATYSENYYGNPTRYRIGYELQGNRLNVQLEPGPCQLVGTTPSGDQIPLETPCSYPLAGVRVLLSVPSVGDCEMTTDANGLAACDLADASFSQPYPGALSIDGTFAGQIPLARGSSSEAAVAEGPEPRSHSLTPEEAMLVAFAVCAVKIWGEDQCAEHIGAAACTLGKQMISGSEPDLAEAGVAELKDRLARSDDTLGAIIAMADMAECLQSLARR